jgi:hypothetical protein
MLEFLNEYLASRRAGTAPVSIRLVGQKSMTKVMLWAVDETGIVVTAEDEPPTHVAFPWTSIVGVYVER